MGIIHNLQIVISQSPLLKHLNEGQLSKAANGTQILNVVEQEKVIKNLSTVRELSEVERTEKEDPKKRRIKKSSSDRLLDLYE